MTGRLTTGRRLETAAVWVLLAASLAASGCASTPTPEATAPTSPSTSATTAPPRIMVTLAGNQRPQWDRITYELSLAHSLRVHQRWRMRALDLYCIVFELPLGRSTDLAVRRLAADHRVETVEPISSYRTLSNADPYAHLQHASRAMRVGAAHRWATGDGVRVAVVDTGIDVGHPDLRGRIDAAQNFVERGEKTFTSDVHGTAVAGVLAAAEDNGTGIAGVAPQARLLALKACWPTAPGSSAAECDNYTLSKAIDWALAEESRVINLSLTGPRDPVLVRLLDAALERGVAVVAAAQDGPDLGFPASHPGVIAVRASEVESGDPYAGDPNDSDRVLAAPGVDILSTTPGGGYEFFSGSSMAAALVSGVAALLLEKRPLLTPPELARALHGPMRRLHGMPEEGPAAVGRTVDACAALAGVLGQDATLCEQPVGLAGTATGGDG